jgi:hypothetical protein
MEYLHKFAENIQEGCRDLLVSMHQPMAATKLAPKATMDALVAKAIKLQDDSNRWSNSILHKAEEVRRTNSRNSTYAGWISTGLYTVGWGLGLAGRLYGVGDVVGGD